MRGGALNHELQTRRDAGQLVGHWVDCAADRRGGCWDMGGNEMTDCKFCTFEIWAGPVCKTQEQADERCPSHFRLEGDSAPPSPDAAREIAERIVWPDGIPRGQTFDATSPDILLYGRITRELLAAERRGMEAAAKIAQNRSAYWLREGDLMAREFHRPASVTERQFEAGFIATAIRDAMPREGGE